MEKSKNIKPSILCPICNKRYIKNIFLNILEDYIKIMNIVK